MNKHKKYAPNFSIMLLAFSATLLSLSGCNQTVPKLAGENDDRLNGVDVDFDNAELEPKSVERSLFDGKSMDGWMQTEFGGHAEATVVDGEIIMEAGYPVAGINREREEELPTTDYEISLEAKRIEGIDFFCGLTFPVQDSHCTLIVGGWAGATVGLSCIDDLDASSNDTTSLMDLEDDRWYAIKVKVTDEAIVCWIDNEEVVNQKIKGHKISIRGDVTACRPLGLCAFESKVAYRNILLSYQEKPDDKGADSKNEKESAQNSAEN